MSWVKRWVGQNWNDPPYRERELTKLWQQVPIQFATHGLVHLIRATT